MQNGKPLVSPLVSVMMPYYNCAETLPLALASLLAQTMTDWECWIVDDGSTQDPEPIVRRANDPRIHLLRLGSNQGRARARQAALDAARGEYLCMLDADDWWFPGKLQHQLQLLNENPGLSLVSGGMCIVNGDGTLSGIRRMVSAQKGFAVHEPLKRPVFLPIPHAPTMLRMSVAKRYRYDPDLKSSEDLDFLLQILLENRYGVSCDFNYVYRRTLTTLSSRASRAIEQSDGLLLALRGFRRKYPFSHMRLVWTWHFKDFCYRVLARLGLNFQIFKFRDSSPLPGDAAVFAEALQGVQAVKTRIFGNF